MTEKRSDPILENKCVNTIRMLAVDSVQKANSGHPGMAMGMADCAFVLWSQFMSYNPDDPHWLNRDRFILSAGHGSILLYSMLYLCRYAVTKIDLQNFRQWGSKTPGHPEYGCLPGIETTTGPLGQGFANGVGMALAAKIMGEKFNTDDFSPINHKIFDFVSDGDLMEGISSEAASLAGHLGLGNLIYIYDNNHITIEGSTSLTFSEDIPARFSACGWQVLSIDGHDHNQIQDALTKCIKETNRPSLIAAETHIGFGSPNKQDSANAHGSPLGEDEVGLTKEKLGWPVEPKFYVPNEVENFFKQRVEKLKYVYKDWQQKFSLWKKDHPQLSNLFREMVEKKLPVNLEEKLYTGLNKDKMATRNSSGMIINRLSHYIPWLMGGSADLAPSTKTFIQNSPSIIKGDYKGRNIHFGIREHGMGGVLNGMAQYKGIVPFGSTFLVFSDYMRPSIRLAALMKLQVIYVFTHDSIFVGEDGPTHQPVEHLASLRSIPGLNVFRPADELETAAAWIFALETGNAPTALCLTRQAVPQLKREKNFNPAEIKKGGYIISKEQGSQNDLQLIASGSEVNLALEAKKLLLREGRKIRIISMPSLDVFFSQSITIRNNIVDKKTPVVVIEAGVSQGWYGITRAPMLFIGMERMGASAPMEVLTDKFGFTSTQVVDKILKWL